MQTTTHTPADVPDTADTAKTDPDADHPRVMQATMRRADVIPGPNPRGVREPKGHEWRCPTCGLWFLGPSLVCCGGHPDCVGDATAAAARSGVAVRDPIALRAADWLRRQADWVESRA